MNYSLEMSSGGYRHHKDGRYRRGRPLSRSPQRDQCSKQISRSRTTKHVSDSQSSRGRTVRKKSLDAFVNANLDDMDIATDDSNSPLQKSLPDSESSSDHDGTPIPDHDGTPIPDHVWVGEYLDEGEDKGTVPRPCDTYAKEIAYKKAISEVSSSSGPDFMNLNRLLRGENEYFSSGGRFSLPFMHGLGEFQRGDGELMPPPMPRIGVTQTDSMAMNQTLKRYHELYKTWIESMEYRPELEKKHSELMQQTLAKPRPAEIYDYDHGENRASTSREKRERKKSTEFFKYMTKSQGVLRSPSNFLDVKGRGRYDDSEKRKHRASVEPIIPTQITEPEKRVTAKSSSPRSRLVIPKTTPFLFEEFCKLQESHSAMDVPITSSSRFATPATKPFTFQELCDLRKALSRHSSSISPSESDSSYIPVNPSLVKTSKDSSQEGFPIKVLTTSCRARRRTTKDKEEFSRTQAGKSGESRQPIAQVTPLRIKPILKKVNRDPKTGTLKKDSPEKIESYYAQNSTYGGRFNDTRKVLLDAAKELESRSSKELLTSPRIVVRNAALANPLLQAALPFHMKRHSPDEAFKARRSDQREFVKSLFPFHKSLQDSGKKSDDSDDEVEMIRRKRFCHSPSPKRRRCIQSRSRSPPTSKKPRGTRSRSLSPRTRYHKKINQVITPHQYTEKRSHSDVSPQRLAMPPDKSETDISESSRGKFGQECYKYDGARALDDSHRRMLRDTGRVYHNVRNEHSHSVDRQAERAEDIRSADRSPVTNIDIQHGKREDRCSSSRHSGIRSVDKDPRERSSSGHRHSPHYHQIKASISPESHEIFNSGKRWQVTNQGHCNRDQPARDRQIQISRSPEKEQKSGPGQRLHLLPDGCGMAVSGHARQFYSRERLTSFPERRVYSDSVQQHKEPSLERQVCTSHSPRRRDGNKTNPYDKSRRPVKRPLRSKSRSTERMVPHYNDRERNSLSSSLWMDENKLESSVRKVHRQYKQETVDSIIQEKDIPRLLDVEIAPLPSLMDVDVKSKDERRFTSRSTSKERATPTTISETIFHERQAKKIITNPSGKIVLKRKDEAKPQLGEGKICRVEGKLKATVTPGKDSARKTAKAKSTATLATTKSKESSLPVKDEKKPIGGTKFPQLRRAVKTESTEKPVHLKRLRKHEWLENYKFWFHQTVHQVLQDSEQAKELGFQDPISFLDSVTKGNRRSLSFVPRGAAAKEILKFIALNKKSIDVNYNKETYQTMVKEEGKSTAPEEAKAGSAVRASIRKTNSSSTEAVKECDQGNKFFVIDKKPMEAQIGVILTKKTDEEGDVKGALKKVISPQKSLKTKEQVVKTPTDRKFGVDRKPKAKSSSFIKSNCSTDLPKSALSSVNQVKSSDPKPHPTVCHTANQLSPVDVTALQTAGHENFDLNQTESTPTDPNASTDQKLPEETGQLNETGSPKEAKFRSWQDALLFPADGEENETDLTKDSETADVNVALPFVKSPIPHVEKECTVTHANLFEPTTTTTNTISKSSKMAVVTPTVKRPTKQSQLEVKEKQGYAQKSVAKSKEEPDRSSAKTLTDGSRQKSAPRKSLPKKKAAMSKTLAKANIPNATMQSKSNVLPDSDKKKSAKPTTERLSSDSAKSPVFPALTDLPILDEASNDPVKAARVIEKFERRKSHSSTRNRLSDFTEHKSTSRRKLIDKATPRHSGRSDSKRNPSETILKRDPTDVPSHESSKSRRGHIEIPKTEPDLTPEQESLLPAFKRQIEKSVLKNLNILYKLEKFKEYKIVNAANDAINFASANKEAGFTLQHAFYYIWRLYENPSKNALDNIKRQMRKVDLEEPCFDINLKTFFLFQSTVFDLCQQNLNNQVRYASQDHERKKYVRLQSEYHFPQFDCEAHVMMKMWAWHERMYSIAQNNTVHSSSARLKPFPGDGDFNSMEESVAKWLKEVTNMRIYDCKEALSCDLIYEVKRQLMKRKAHATRREAIVLIARAWTRNYYYKFEKTLLRNSQSQESEKKVESGDHGELMVLDEVYSDESDSGDNIEDSSGVTDDLSGVQIDLF